MSRKVYRSIDKRERSIESGVSEWMEAQKQIDVEGRES